jgi:glutamyl-tRNA reductase
LKTHLVLVGLSHHSAPVELREQVDFIRRGLPGSLDALMNRPGVGETVVLSTCNRAELYATCTDPAAAEHTMRTFLAEFHGLAPELVAPHLYALSGDAAARHLFRVAAGLDSLVVGEPQILGQVKDAYTVAAERHCTGALLNKLFHWAFAVGKRVRSETGLAEGAVSVSFAAVSLARKIFGRLNELTVLVLGTGEMGALTARHLQGQRVKRMLLASRTESHAAALADEIGATVVPWSDVAATIHISDIVVTATGSPKPIVTRRHVHEAMRSGRERPLFLIDIAVPRDVEPSAGDLEQVFLYNIDDLRGIVQENLARRGAEMDRANRIVEEEVADFAGWLRSRDAIPTVVALRQRFESIRRAELKRLEPKIAELSPEARARIDEITRLIVEKLLLTPTEQLKAASDDETVVAFSDALSRLFSLASPEEPPEPIRAGLKNDPASTDPVES